MKNILSLDEFLLEKKVTIKRKYTDIHPEKNAYSSTKIRTLVLDAIADGQITEEELTKILAEINANKNWLKVNSNLFDISEDNDQKVYKLSNRGKKIFTLGSTINEKLNVIHKERGKIPVNIFVGRFQPFTLGHIKVFESMYKKNGHPVVVFIVRSGNADLEKNPFNEDLQQSMFVKMSSQYKFLEAAFVVNNAAIDTLFSIARPAYEPILWGYGTDRAIAYDKMITNDSYRVELGVDDSFSGFEIQRTDEDISASKVRNSLKIDDHSTFKKLMPTSLHSFYEILKDSLKLN